MSVQEKKFKKQKRHRMNRGEWNIFRAIIMAFPATNWQTAYDHAIQGGIKFN